METSVDEEKKPKEHSKKKELPPNMQKICLVCGDKALGYNFNVISCESCKAFFRRNALTSKELKCPFTNNCEITVVTRRFCQKCRLEKCLSIGMVKEFIMSEEDKAEKRKKIEENRAKKRKTSMPGDEPVSSSKSFKHEDDSYTPNGIDNEMQYNSLNSTSCSPSSTVRSPLGSDVDNSHSATFSQYVPVKFPEYTSYPAYPEGPKYLEVFPMNEKPHQQPPDTYEEYQKKQNSIKSILLNSEPTSLPHQNRQQSHVCSEMPSTASEDPDVNKARDILQDIEKIEPHSMESILCEAIKLEFEGTSSLSSCSGSSRELNEVERAKLNELIVASKALHQPIDDDVSALVGSEADFKCGSTSHAPELINIVNLTAIAIRRLIKMAKKISAFKNMCEEDQVALLKGGSLEMMVLRSVMNYDGQRNTWNIPHNNAQFEAIKTDVLKLAKGGLYQAHEAFIGSFKPEWRSDEHLILILSAILLFTPTRPGTVHRDVIKLEQNSYYYLLRRYLESVHAGCEARATFLQLVQKVRELGALCRAVTGVYLDVSPIEPLLVEIFDLNHQKKP